MKDNKGAFLRSVKGAQPIKKSNKLSKPIPKAKKTGIIKKIKFKTSNTKTKQNTINKTEVQSLEIQNNETNKKLKKGKIPIDKKIDFHGLSVIDAESLFYSTVESCFKKKQRCILFITGKGIVKKSTNPEDSLKLYYGKIRNNFSLWSKKPELQKYILNIQEAGLKYGADGAFFVYLRKNKS